MATTAGYDVIELQSQSPLPPPTPINPNRYYDPQLPLYTDRGAAGAGAKSPPIVADDKRSPPPPPSRGSSWDVYPQGGKYDQGPEAGISDAAAGSGRFGHRHERSRISRVYHWLLDVSIVTRWIIFILPIMAVLWIPGILGLTKFPNATVWGVKLLWWSIWLSIIWGGWWASLAVARILPAITRLTLGVVAIGTRRYIDWLLALHRYIALFIWTLVLWIAWGPLIQSRQIHATPRGAAAITLIGKLSFVIYLCAALLLFEKFAIQWIAGKFHERSYAERIADQKFAVHALVVLYQHSVDNHGRGVNDVSPGISDKADPLVSRRMLKKALNGVKTVASSTTTVFGDVASEIMGSSVLQPYSPKAMVKTALESANKSRLLARRLFYSFVKPEADYMVVGDIRGFFPTVEDADVAFALFDKDGNGDVTKEDMEMACMELHREQLSLEHSMQDLDSAVGRLDNILMTLYIFVVILIIAVALDSQLQTLIAGAGTLVLGLSWLIGASLQEVLASIVFLFVKHPFDVGDRINVNKTDYTVKEIWLLTSLFVDASGTLVQVPNTMLNNMFIQNYRRSSQMSEPFMFDVSYATTFDQLETLRKKMLEFLQNERRDFQCAFDVSVVDFPEQGRMTLKADIKYKSNWQQGTLKAQRRNKWICALKQALADVKIFGPGGDPDAKPDPKKVTMVPWEEVQQEEAMQQSAAAAAEMAAGPDVPLSPVGGWNLSDKNAVIMGSTDDVLNADSTRSKRPPA